jgi:DNA-binding winged helix-turn-helix (wHTH) protein
VRNHGHILTKGELLNQVWPDTFVEEVNLAVNISAIRKALGENA